MRLRTGLFAFCLALGTVSSTAHAAGVDPAVATAVQREQAQSRYVRGKKKFDDNDYPGALEEFHASLEIVASPNARLYAARALQKMGRLVEAYAEFGRTAVEAKEHEHEDGRYAKAGDAAAAERKLLIGKLGFVDIKVSNANDETRLTVGGVDVKPAAWQEPLPVMPGDVDVEVDTPNIAPVRSHAHVAAGAHVALTLDAGASGVTANAPALAETSPDAKSSMKWALPATIAAGGVAVAGLITFTVAGALSLGTYSSLKGFCGTAACPPSKASDVSRGQTQQAVANVGLGIAIVGVVATGVFFTLYLTSKDAHAPTAVYVSPNEVGVRGTF